MEKLFVDTFIKSQSPQLGQSKPLLVQASDGNKYFLKNNMVNFPDEWKNENCAFFNEVLSHKITNFFNIATPDIAALCIEQDLMTANADMLFNRRLKAGLYFGTKVIENVEDNLLNNYLDLLRMNKPYIKRSWNQYFKNVSNSNDIPAIIAMDILLANFDRFNNNGNLIVGNSSGGRKIYAIDHGHCFCGPFFNHKKIDFLNSNKFSSKDDRNSYIDKQIWNIISIAQYNNKKHCQPFNSAGEIFKAIESHVDLSDLAHHSFTPFYQKLQKLNQSTLTNMISDIPNEWIVGGQLQIKNYIDFIMRQIDILPLILQRMASLNAFSNYRGGELLWKTENLTGTL